MIKDMNAQPIEEVNRETSGSVQSTGASFSIELERTPLPVDSSVHLQRSSPNPAHLRFCGGIIMQEWPIINSTTSPFPLCRMSGGIKFPSFQSGFGLLVTSPLPEATQDPPSVAPLEREAILSPRKFQGSLCQGLGSKCKYENKRCSWHLEHLGNHKGFRSTSQMPGQRPKHRLLMTSQHHTHYWLLLSSLVIVLLTLRWMYGHLNYWYIS